MSYASKNPEQAKELLHNEEGWIFVDVRTVEEFEQGHVPDAYTLPIALRGPWGMSLNPSFVDVFERNFQTQGKYILGCAVGGRSAKACEILAQHGFLRSPPSPRRTGPSLRSQKRQRRPTRDVT